MANMMPVPVAPNAVPGRPQAIPLYDLFLDLPHPAASSSCPPPFILGAPTNTPDMENELSSNISRIARFAFPEFDDAISQRIPRESGLNRFSQYAMQPKSFQHYTFSLQLQSGVRLHGHVRRYLPVHSVAKSRYDVGRRGERALVLLTRSSGGDLVYSAILKTMDAISFQVLALDEQRQAHKEPQKWFLHRLFDEHRKLCANFAALPQQERKPMILTVENLEVGEQSIPLIDQVDTSRFLLPTSLMSPTSAVVESVSSSSILPLLRVLGVQNTLRLLSALLSESRVLLISASPTRLAQCARSALSILAQGLLNWQHLYIPVLPPHLFQYLAAPVPYLIGMLSTLAPRLDQAKSDGLGEMVIINLDTIQMETRGINPADVAQKIPDLFRTAMAEQGLPAASMSASEMLAQDLVDLLKVDKRTLFGESALTNVSETAAKATKAVKTGFMKLKQKGKQFLKNRTGSSVSDGSLEDDMADDGGRGDGQSAPDLDTQLPDYIYTQGAQNETAEEEARIAFTSFFLSLFGNMRWYLSASPGKLPQLDRKRFLQQKRSMGEGENTPVWPLLQNFCQTQMLEEFAKARVEEVRTRHPVTSDSPLFTQCANYHRLHGIDFSVVNVRRVARQVAQNSPSRSILQTTARRTAMLLTSNRTFEGDYNKAVAHLVEQCRESSSVLFDVMSVIWVRLRDSKGLHWKHGLQALQILRNLLYHGPLAAIAEATDGLDKIRMMKFYNDNMRSQICTQLRQAANQVYNLLVDRAKLFNIRRLCINKRRLLRNPDQGRFTKDSRVQVFSPFSKVHSLFDPRSRAQVASNSNIGVQFAADQDLLGFNVASNTAAAPAANPFDFAVTSQPAEDSAYDPQPLDDLVDEFEGVSVGDVQTNLAVGNRIEEPAQLTRQQQQYEGPPQQLPNPGNPQAVVPQHAPNQHQPGAPTQPPGGLALQQFRQPGAPTQPPGGGLAPQQYRYGPPGAPQQAAGMPPMQPQQQYHSAPPPQPNQGIPPNSVPQLSNQHQQIGAPYGQQSTMARPGQPHPSLPMQPQHPNYQQAGVNPIQQYPPQVPGFAMPPQQAQGHPQYQQPQYPAGMHPGAPQHPQQPYYNPPQYATQMQHPPAAQQMQNPPQPKNMAQFDPFA